MKKLLQSTKGAFIEMLENSISMYKLIGTPQKESPMWLQLKPVESPDSGDDTLLFESSQSNVWMRISCTPEVKEYVFYNFTDAYDYFKYLKYNHIKEHYPTVWEELAIGSNGVRINDFMNSYQPPVEKPRIEQLMESGQLTVEEVMEYAQKHMDAVDQYDDIEQYFDQYNMEYEQAEHERMMYSENMYGSDYDDMPQHIRSPNPEYVIASTSNRTEETYVFEGSSDGKILDMGEYGGIAKRFGDDNWKDHQNAVKVAMGHIPYRFEIEIPTERDDVRHFLYSRIGSADYWDGE